MEDQEFHEMKQMADAKHKEVHRFDQQFGSNPYVKVALDAFDQHHNEISKAASAQEGRDAMQQLIAAAENCSIAIDGARFDEEDLVMLDKQATRMHQTLHKSVSDSEFANSDKIANELREFDDAHETFKSILKTRNLDNSKEAFHDLNVAKSKVMTCIEQMRKDEAMSHKGEPKHGMREVKTEHMGHGQQHQSMEETKIEE